MQLAESSREPKSKNEIKGPCEARSFSGKGRWGRSKDGTNLVECRVVGEYRTRPGAEKLTFLLKLPRSGGPEGG